MTFQVSAQLESMSSRVDGTTKLVFGTQVVTPPEAALMFELVHKQGWVLFKDGVIEEQEVPDEPVPEFKTDKSPSQRLRSTLYVYWEKNTNKLKPFDTFYNEWIDRKVQEIKDTLNP